MARMKSSAQSYAHLGTVWIFELLHETVEGFRIHLIDKTSTLPRIVSHIVEEGFLAMAAFAFKYFSTRNKRILNQGPAVVASNKPVPPPKSKGFDDNAGCNGPHLLYISVTVTRDVNIKPAIKHIGWNTGGTGIKISWKHHQ